METKREENHPRGLLQKSELHALLQVLQVLYHNEPTIFDHMHKYYKPCFFCFFGLQQHEKALKDVSSNFSQVFKKPKAPGKGGTKGQQHDQGMTSLFRPCCALALLLEDNLLTSQQVRSPTPQETVVVLN